MQIHRYAWACALVLCGGAYAQELKFEAGKGDPAQAAMAEFYDCAKKYSEKYSKSREPAADIADAALSYCESPRERLRGLLIDKLSVGGRSAREQVNALFPGLIEKARLLSIRTVVEARYEATLKANAAPSVAAQPPAPAPTTATIAPPVPAPVTGSPQPVTPPLAGESGRPSPEPIVIAPQPSPPPTTSATQPAPQPVPAPAASTAIQPESSDATSIVMPVTFPDGTSVVTPLPPPMAPPPAPAPGTRPRSASAVVPDTSPIIVRPPPAPDL